MTSGFIALAENRESSSPGWCSPSSREYISRLTTTRRPSSSAESGVGLKTTCWSPPTGTQVWLRYRRGRHVRPVGRDQHVVFNPKPPAPEVLRRRLVVTP